jgi:DNA polymerase III sliding clamp (beta) subunit (PCNA family)
MVLKDDSRKAQRQTDFWHWRTIMHLLPTNLGPLADITADNTRYALSGVKITLKDDTYEACATDAKILAIIEGGCENEKDYPSIPAFDNAPNGKSECLVPAELWRSAFAEAKKITKKRFLPPILKHTAIKIGDNEVTLASTNLEESPVKFGKQLEGRFPSVNEVLPKKELKPLVSFQVDVDLMINLLKTAKIVGESVTISVFDPKEYKLVSLNSKGENQVFKGVIFPLNVTLPKPEEECITTE